MINQKPIAVKILGKSTSIARVERTAMEKNNKKLKQVSCGSVMYIDQAELHMGFTRLLYVVVVVGRPFNCTDQHI